MNRMTVLTPAQLNSSPLEPAGIRVGADSGDPQLHVMKVAFNAGGRVGIWECQPGGWPVVDRPDTEIAYILSGVADITDSDGIVRTISGGDMLILPPGWSGRWDVKETVRKFYAIY